MSLCVYDNLASKNLCVPTWFSSDWTLENTKTKGVLVVVCTPTLKSNSGLRNTKKALNSEMATGCRSTSALLAAPCVSQHVVGTACTAGRTPCNILSLLTNNNLHERPSMPRTDLQHGYHKSPRGVLPLFMHTGLRLHTPRSGGWTHVWTASHQQGCTWWSSSLSSWLPRAPMEVSHRLDSAYRVSSMCPLPRLCIYALAPPPRPGKRLYWVFSVSPESTTDDPSPLL